MPKRHVSRSTGKMNDYIPWLIINVLFLKSWQHPLITNTTKRPRTNITGDFMVGALVAIHDAGGVNNLKCDDEISAVGVQRLEAMRYAIDQVVDLTHFSPVLHFI